MSFSTFSVFSTIFGFITAAISLLAFLVSICRSHLPRNKIKVLESLLEETDACFGRAIEEKLLKDSFIRRTNWLLGIYKVRAGELRSRTEDITNLREDYVEFFQGTSKAIGTACQKLKQLKAQVIRSSEQGRTLPETHAEDQRCANVMHNPEIPRPRSCPPALAGFKLVDTGHILTPNNTTDDDTMQSDRDIRTGETQNGACICTYVRHSRARNLNINRYHHLLTQYYVI